MRGSDTAPAAPPAPTEPRAIPALRRPALGGRNGLLAVLGTVAAALAAAGFLVGRSGSGKDETPKSSLATAAAGPVRLTYPTSWRRLSSAPALPGLRFGDALALARAGSDGALVAGSVAARPPSFLPASLVARMPGGRPARRELVRLGQNEAYRYRNVPIRGFSRPLTLYVVPTGQSPPTLVCYGDADLLSACDRIAATLKTPNAKAHSVGRLGPYAGTLNAVVSTLNAVRSRNLGAMRKAKKPADQAKAAHAIAAAYRSAARRLARAPVTPAVRSANTSIVAALKQAAPAYQMLATSAEQGDRTLYGVGRSMVASREAALSSRISRLRGLGFTLGGATGGPRRSR